MASQAQLEEMQARMDNLECRNQALEKEVNFNFWLSTFGLFMVGMSGKIAHARINDLSKRQVILAVPPARDH